MRTTTKLSNWEPLREIQEVNMSENVQLFSHYRQNSLRFIGAEILSRSTGWLRASSSTAQAGLAFKFFNASELLGAKKRLKNVSFPSPAKPFWANRWLHRTDDSKCITPVMPPLCPTPANRLQLTTNPIRLGRADT